MTSGAAGVPPERIEKIMSLSAAEMARSLDAFVPGTVLDGDGRALVRYAGATVAIRYEPLPPHRPGGRIALPQGRVTIDLTALDPSDRAAFMRRFDIAFQRGGG